MARLKGSRVSPDYVALSFFFSVGCVKGTTSALYLFSVSVWQLLCCALVLLVHTAQCTVWVSTQQQGCQQSHKSHVIKDMLNAPRIR